MTLKFYEAIDIDDLDWPDDYEEISKDSSCLHVLTDFKIQRPLIIESGIGAHVLEELMLTAHVRLKIVVDKDGHFLGVIALEDLKHPDFLSQMAAVYDEEKITVVDVMRPRSTLRALSFVDIEQATIWDVINFLQDYTYQHCLVIDTERKRLRGLISVSDVARKLKIRVRVQESPSFAQLYEAAR